MPHPVPIYKNDFVEALRIFRSFPALPAIRKTTALLDNRLHSASPPQKRPFLNWNGSNRTSEIPAIFPMPQRYTGIRSKSPFAMSHDRRRGFFVSDLPAPAIALVPAQCTVPEVV
jgi:hypothetical protein